MKYTFCTEDGTERDMEYSAFLQDAVLMRRVNDPMRLNLNLGKLIVSYDREWLDAHKDKKEEAEWLQRMQRENPLRFYMPCCAAHDDFDSPAHLFINDLTTRFCGFIAHNRHGKSTAAFIKLMAALGSIPCDPEWPIFKDHGVRYTPFTGPQELFIMSYKWQNHKQTIIPQIIKKWLPISELGDIAHKEINPEYNSTLRLKCGTRIHLFASSQSQEIVESLALDKGMWDEQGEETKFDGIEARLATRIRKVEDNYVGGVHLGAFTPHKVQGRPDTGADGWMYNMCHPSGMSDIKGMSPNPTFYTGVLDDVPHWVFPEESKQEKKDLIKSTEEAYKRGRATIGQVHAVRSRWLGEWEVGGGGVFANELDHRIHVIDDFKIPPNWTVRRGFDHGRTNPSSMVLIATSPDGFCYVTNSYLYTGTIADTVRYFVEKCGNHLIQTRNVSSSNHTITCYKEIYENLTSYADFLDPRTFKVTSDSTRYSKGDFWKFAGLARLRPAPHSLPEDRIEIIRSLMRVDRKLKNPLTGELGSPRIFFFRKGAAGLVKNMTHYRNKEVMKNGVMSEKPVAKDDHDIDALGYGIVGGTAYKPHAPCQPQKVCIRREIDEPIKKRRRDPYTGA